MDKREHRRPDLPKIDPAGYESCGRLESWKEIAFYLGRSEKTVRRWEGTEGLPVHRLHHQKRGSVYAYSGELEAWREARKTGIGSEPAVPDSEVEVGAGHPERPNSRKGVPARRLKSWQLGFIAAALCITGSLVGMHWGALRNSAVRASAPVRIQSLVVLPLANLSRNAGQEYLADGLTEQIVAELGRVGSARVISSASAMRYKSSTKSPREIAGDLNVDAALEGAFVRDGTRIRITTQLIPRSAERYFRSEVYEADARNVFDLPRLVARDIERKIDNGLPAKPPVSTGSERSLDPRTYESYLRGRHFLASRNADGMKKAVGYFEEAIRTDPRYAPAYAGLAVAYDLLGTYEVLPPDESFPKAKDFADQALQLDDTLAEAYTARGMATSFWELNWSAAGRDFQRAIALDPSFALAHHWYAEYWIGVGSAGSALAEMKRARELDPLSLAINGTLGRVYRDAGQYEEALHQCRQTVDLDPHFAMGHWCLGQVYVGKRFVRSSHR